MSEFHYTIDTRKYICKMCSFCGHFGLNIDLNNPKTIQDKLAWLNIYDEDPLKVICSDKIKVRDYVKDKLVEDISVPIIKVYNSVNDINIDELPDKFVLKCNHGSGMNIIVQDKTKLNMDAAKRQLSIWMDDDFSMRNGFESHYHDIEHKCFAETYVESNGDIPYDYKFLCFNGEPKLVQVCADRFNSNKHMNYYDMDFNFVKLARTDFRNRPDVHHERPETFDLMKEYARKLSEPFKFVRVDLYEIDGKVYFGEMTFTPGACGFKYKNQEDNLKMGKMLKL